ncbi:hypothetical protein HYT53_00860 [Candidatus Woesearchaeota archaeon]|nr:hypothetical protein [Candidatus Woesearchaeota archaeon]
MIETQCLGASDKLLQLNLKLRKLGYTREAMEVLDIFEDVISPKVNERFPIRYYSLKRVTERKDEMARLYDELIKPQYEQLVTTH